MTLKLFVRYLNGGLENYGYCKQMGKYLLGKKVLIASWEPGLGGGKPGQGTSVDLPWASPREFWRTEEVVAAGKVAALVVRGQLLPGGTWSEPDTTGVGWSQETFPDLGMGCPSLSGSTTHLLPSACLSLGLSRTRNLKTPSLKGD